MNQAVKRSISYLQLDIGWPITFSTVHPSNIYIVWISYKRFKATRHEFSDIVRCYSHLALGVPLSWNCIEQSPIHFTLRKISWIDVGFLHVLRFLHFTLRLEMGNSSQKIISFCCGKNNVFNENEVQWQAGQIILRVCMYWKVEHFFSGMSGWKEIDVRIKPIQRE